MRSCLFLFSFPPLGRAFAVLLAALCLAVPSRLSAAAADGQRFESIDDAVKALTEAVRNGDTNAIRIIFGPAGQELVSPDVVQAGAERTLFMNRVREKAETVRESDTKAILHLGSDGWPFPIPLVKWEGRWFFETEAGAEEILNRRIGMNEIGAIRVCRAYVEAQHEYYSQDRNGDGVVEYAQKLRSGSGLRDGLYWPANPGEPLSPLGPLIAKARVEGYRPRRRIQLHHQRSHGGRVCFGRVARRMGQLGRDDIPREPERQGLSKEPGGQNRRLGQPHWLFQPRP